MTPRADREYWLLLALFVVAVLWAGGAFAADSVSWSTSSANTCTRTSFKGTGSSAAAAAQSFVDGWVADCTANGSGYTMTLASVSTEVFASGAYTASMTYGGTFSGSLTLAGFCTPNCTGDTGGSTVNVGTGTQIADIPPNVLMLMLGCFAAFGVGFIGGRVR